MNQFITIAREDGLRQLTCMLIGEAEADAIRTLSELGFDPLIHEAANEMTPPEPQSKAPGETSFGSSHMRALTPSNLVSSPEALVFPAYRKKVDMRCARFL